MSVGEKIYAYLSAAKRLDRRARIGDFQMQVEKDSVTIVNLKTQAERAFFVDKTDEPRF
jgi:hypothetical protein